MKSISKNVYKSLKIHKEEIIPHIRGLLESDQNLLNTSIAKKSKWDIALISYVREKYNDSNMVPTVKQLFDAKIVFKALIVYLNIDLDSIVKDKPLKLLDISNRFNTRFRYYLSNKTFKNVLNGYFSYENFKNRKYNNVALVKSLNIRVCPYCNRQYTIGINKSEETIGRQVISRKKRFTPQLDHYFPHADHPILALSFYNLIPSCSFCNGLKSKFDVGSKPHFHPYMDKVEPSFVIKFKVNEDKNVIEYSYELESSDQLKLDNSNEAFGLSDIYEEHKYEFDIIIDKYNRYGNGKLEKFRKYFTKRGGQITFNSLEKDIFDLVDEKCHGQTPLDKFKYDIYGDLKRNSSKITKLKK